MSWACTFDSLQCYPDLGVKPSCSNRDGTHRADRGSFTRQKCSSLTVQLSPIVWNASGMGGIGGWTVYKRLLMLILPCVAFIWIHQSLAICYLTVWSVVILCLYIIMKDFGWTPVKICILCFSFHTERRWRTGESLQQFFWCITISSFWLCSFTIARMNELRYTVHNSISNRLYGSSGPHCTLLSNMRTVI